MAEDLCRWCDINAAITTLLGWRTCKSCIDGGPVFRVKRWCHRVARGPRAMKRIEREE